MSTNFQSALSPALMPITVRPDNVMLHGHGSRLWDDSDRAYLDLVQGWAVNALGHCPDEITDAIASQARKLLTPSPAFHNLPQHRLAERLRELSGLDQVHFSNSGSEANEVAVKLARKWGQRHRGGAHEVITTVNGFHGRTLAMMAASGKPGWDAIFAPAPVGFKKVPFGDAQAMSQAVGAQTVALMVEPIQGEAGVIVPPDGYLAALRDIADQHGILLILDEVQTGIGRCGESFAYQCTAANAVADGAKNVLPDIVTLGKGLGGGVPISATLAREHVCHFEPGDQGGTYNGNPLMCAVALAVVNTVCEPAFLAHVCQTGRHFVERLQSLARDSVVADVRGRGLLLAIRLAEPVAEQVRNLAFDRGLLINAPRPDSIRFMPSLRLTTAEIDETIDILRDCLDSL